MQPEKGLILRVSVKKFKKTCQHNYSLVETLEVVNTIRSNAEVRNDDWGREILLRLGNVIDLVAAKGRYNRTCYTYFLRPNCGKPGTSKHQVRQPDDDKSKSFLRLCDYLKNNDKQFSLDELMCIMKNFEGTNTVYSKKHLKRKLEEHFGNHITVTGIRGKSGVLCFTRCMNDILSDE